MIVDLVNFAEYQDEITGMMMDMLHLEPQTVDIPVEQYIKLQENGILKPFLWVDGETIKGVALLFVSPSLRNPAILDAATDVIWVKPEHRGKSQSFIQELKTALKDMGVDYWYISSRDSHPIDNFLLRQQFNPLERVFYCPLSEG